MQHESGVRPTTINGTVTALRFLFTVTLKRRNLSRPLVITRIVPRMPEVLSVEEAARLLQAAPGIKYKAALGVNDDAAATLFAADVAALLLGLLAAHKVPSNATGKSGVASSPVTAKTARLSRGQPG